MLVSSSNNPFTLFVFSLEEYKKWVTEQSLYVQKQIQLSVKEAKENSLAQWVDGEGQIFAVLILGNSVFDAFGHLSQRLQQGHWQMKGQGFDKEQALLAFMMGSYQFKGHKQKEEKNEALAVSFIVEDEKLKHRLEVMGEAIFMTRNLINEPVNYLSPKDLAEKAQEVAQKFKAHIKIYEGSELEKEFPAVHAVGKSAPHSAPQSPRLVDMRWPKKGGLKLTLVGKGVCFDTGGVNVKPDKSMRLMKKDMGGAANALGLAYMIMGLDLNIDLRLIIPAVENSISAEAMRPGDVYTARNGKSIEIGHTDAEGRVILADGLALASEEENDYIMDMATLTGAARVALGAEIVAAMGNCSAEIQEIIQQGVSKEDPIWELPLFEGYRRHIASSVADVNNAGEGAPGLGGAITAGLFLSEFVGQGQKWMHFDMLAWNNNGMRAGHPKGGEAMAIRALLAWLEKKQKA